MLADVQRAIAARPAGARLLVLSDYDGTLAEFDPDPSVPRPAPQTAAALARLAARADASLGVVSGRRIDDLRTRIALPERVYLAGLHGMEIEVGERRWQHPDLEAASGHIRDLHRCLLQVQSTTPGVILEDKGASMAVHVRAVAPEHRVRTLAWAETCAAEWVASGRLRQLRGNMVLEFLPNIAAHKGEAVRWIARDVEERLQQPPWVVFLGDDVTDEDAFTSIEAGIGVLVGTRPSAATHQLANTRDVTALLEWLATL